MYNLPKTLSSELYRNLIFYSLDFCDTFLLVIRDTIPESSSAKQIIDKLQPYLISHKKKSEWPGTKLLLDNANVYQFKLSSESATSLTEINQGFHSWIQPNFPEDLCLMRSDGSPWLVTISHENDVYLDISPEERDRISKAIPKLQFEN